MDRRLLLIAAVAAAVGHLVAHLIYQDGYAAGLEEGEMRYVKRRSQPEGNIIKYPFRIKSGKAAETGSGDSVAQSENSEKGEVNGEPKPA